MLPLKISGVGLAVPNKKERKEDFIRRGIPEEKIEAFGVYERRMIEDGQSISDLEVIAAQNALEDADMEPSEIDVIISGSTLPMMVGTPNSNLLQDRIGARNAVGFDMMQTCATALPAMIVAANFIAMGQYKNILVTVSTNWSDISDPSKPEADYVLGDGAGAMVLTPASEGFGIISFDMETSGKFYYNCGTRCGVDQEKRYYDNREEKMKFYIDIDTESVEGGKTAFARYLTTSGPKIFKKALKKGNLTPDDIDWAIIHGNVRPVTESWAKHMKIPLEKIPVTYERYGNMSMVTVVANLREALDRKMLNRGDKVAIVSMGAGFSSAAIIMLWE